MPQTNFKIGDKVRILSSYYTRELELSGKEATVVDICNDEPRQIRVEVLNRGKFYLLMSEVEKVA